MCLKSFSHESKVLNATLFRDVIITGCQFGLVVFWDLSVALRSSSSPSTTLDFNDVSCLKILNEHSAAISNVFVDNNELVTDDYDGVVIIRNLRLHSDLKPIFGSN